MFGYIAKCWNGEEKYWKVFILGGLSFLAISLVLIMGLSFLFLLLNRLMPDLSETMIIIFAHLMMMSVIILKLCWIIMCWHCSTRYLAKISLVIILLSTVHVISNYKQTINELVFMQKQFLKEWQKDNAPKGQESIEQMPAPEDKLVRDK